MIIKEVARLGSAGRSKDKRKGEAKAKKKVVASTPRRQKKTKEPKNNTSNSKSNHLQATQRTGNCKSQSPRKNEANNQVRVNEKSKSSAVKTKEIEKKSGKKLKINEIAKKVTANIKSKIDKVLSENKKKRKSATKVKEKTMNHCEKKQSNDNWTKERAKCNKKATSLSSLTKSVVLAVGCGRRNSSVNCVNESKNVKSKPNGNIDIPKIKKNKEKKKESKEKPKTSKASKNKVKGSAVSLAGKTKMKKNSETKTKAKVVKPNKTKKSKSVDEEKATKTKKKTQNRGLLGKMKCVKLKKEQDETAKKKAKTGSSNRRKHREASLNALAKVRMLCENDQEKAENSDHTDNTSLKKRVVKKENEKESKKNQKEENKRKSANSKALVLVDPNKRSLVRKRKLVDDSVEIIDTRSCKRMASLNASAILAASYSPVKRSKSTESNRSGSTVEMIREMQISATVSHIEITPAGDSIDTIHQRAQVNSVILEEEKREMIETIKRMKVSNKIRDRLIGIAQLEQSDETKRKQRGKSKDNVHDSVAQTIGGLSEFQATKVQVTKVTQINSSKSSERDKKSKAHKIETILERNDSVVRKYQVQTKSTSQSFCVQMQTTFDPSTSANLITAATASASMIPSPVQPTSMAGVQLLSSTPAHVIPTSFVPEAVPSSMTSVNQQPTYLNYAGVGHAPILQLRPPPMVATSSAHFNPLSIVNLTEPYMPAQHYSSAFSVPHYATHGHTPYYYPGFYQPTGPLLQSLHDPCLIHKPIPFHPATQPIRHMHTPQFAGSLHTSVIPAIQTFQGDASTGQLFQPNSIRQPPTVLFQTINQPNAPAATFTFINPGINQSINPNINPSIDPNINANISMNQNLHANLINEHFVRPEMPVSSMSLSPSAQPQPQPPAVDTSPEYLCKSVQCSPPSNPPPPPAPTYQQKSPTHMVHPTNNKLPTVVAVRPQMTKRLSKSDVAMRRKKSLFLKPPTNDNRQMTTAATNTVASQTLDDVQIVGPPPPKKVKTALAPSNLNKINNSNNIVNKPQMPGKTKTISIQVSSLPPSPTLQPRLLPLRKPGKKKFLHGWSWEGEPVERLVFLSNEDQPCLRKCYKAIRHSEGDVIKVRDCVLLRSGPRKTDLPFVAKIAALWETPDQGEMMMSLLWYYRPEHTDLEKPPPIQMAGEVFASKHRDTNSVACIDDKCYVLTYNEFCRYQSHKLLKKSPQTRLAATIVPSLEEPYPRADRLPSTRVFPELVFCCRKVYDFRQKRILKNPI